MKKWLGLLCLILVLAMLIPACSSSTPSATTTTSVAPTTTTPKTTTPAVTTSASPTAVTPVKGGKLIWIRNTGIPSVGAPQDIPTYTGTFLLTSPVVETLVLTDNQENIVPWLAQSVDTSADGKTITFNLRKGVKFHDGTDFNAAAVKYNLEAAQKANAAGTANLSNVISMDVVDDSTFRMTLKQYDARLLLSLAQLGYGVMCSPTALAKATTPDNAGKDHLVGTGPFKFDSWAKDQYVRFVRNDNYWQTGKPYLDSIEIRNNPTLATSIMSFKAGEVNMVENIDPSDYVSLKAGGFAVGIPSTLAFVFSMLPDSANADSPFAKLAVRQAAEYAIDKVGMANGIGQGTQFAATQLGAPSNGWYIQNYPARIYDVAKAKQLLTDAGYPSGFTYPMIADVRMRQDQTVALQSYLKEVGINLTLDVADVARITSLQQNGWKGLMVPGFPNWSSFSSWTNRFVSTTITYPSAATPTGWKDGWNTVIGEADFNKRMTLMQALMKQVYDQALIIPYIYDAPRYVTDGTIMDMSWDARNLNGYFDANNVWLKKK
jgi:peptide/nickel transport system substrate-binding protein